MGFFLKYEENWTYVRRHALFSSISHMFFSHLIYLSPPLYLAFLVSIYQSISVCSYLNLSQFLSIDLFQPVSIYLSQSICIHLYFYLFQSVSICTDMSVFYCSYLSVFIYIFFCSYLSSSYFILFFFCFCFALFFSNRFQFSLLISNTVLPLTPLGLLTSLLTEGKCLQLMNAFNQFNIAFSSV